MNKKIKIIELYNKVANNKDLPKQIRWEGMIWTLDVGRDYISETDRTLGSDVRLDELNDYVEILEDNTEDIEELEIDDNGFIHTSKGAWKGRKMDIVFAESLNQLVKAVKQLDKKIINLQSNKKTQQ